MFDCQITKIDDKNIYLLVWSENKIDLHIRAPKLFYNEKESDSALLNKYHFYLDNSNEIIKINYPNINHMPYHTLTFIAIDNTNHKQYAISISFSSMKPIYTEMIYGE